MDEYQEKAQIVDMQFLTRDICRCRLLAPRIAKAARPGQFIMARVGTGHDPLLRRPFSLHATDLDTLSLLFKVVGKGTALLSKLPCGESIDLVGPLGHGFSESMLPPPLLLGGGMGSAPLFLLAQRLRKSAPGQPLLVLLGARDRTEVDFLRDDFNRLGCDVQVATDDGSLGYHGLVTDLLGRIPAAACRVAACGPWPMLRVVARVCSERRLDCEVSLETMMACGLAACLGCAVAGPQGGYVHVCKDGPVFPADQVAWK